MTNEQIEKFLHNPPEHLDKAPVQISFKTRQSIRGIFIKTPDYSELKSKNFWRIVSESKFNEYKGSQDTSLARIFNGAEITRLNKG
jgi:hypothetical protein